MKAKVELEIDKEDLLYELKELVSEKASPELKKMIKSHALPLITAEVDKVLLPVVASVLTNEDLSFNYGYHNYPNNDKLKNRVEAFTKSFLNKSVYDYNRDSKKPSERYAVSSSDSNDTLITCIVKDSIREYINEEFKPIVSEMIKTFISNKAEMEELYKEEAKKLLAELK